MSEYYLIAGLPMIRDDLPPPMQPAEFLALCREKLSAAGARKVQALLEDRPDSHPFTVAWREADTRVRNAIVRVRASRSQVEAAPWLRPQKGVDLRAQEEVEAAFRKPDPLRRQQALDALRFRLIDEILGPDQFSLRVLLAYGLKLRLAVKRGRFDPDKGRQKVEAALRAVEHTAGEDRARSPGQADNGEQGE